MGSTGGRHVSDNLNVGLGIAVISNVQLDCEPWGHMDHSEGHCSCQSSDRTASYVHELALMSREVGMPPSDGGGGGGR